MMFPPSKYYHAEMSSAYPGWCGIVILWLQRAHTRAVLRTLDASRLEDIGLSAEERDQECGKWFWED
jgi:uncharacterized protein YjiS (DUF1127 family)